MRNFYELIVDMGASTLFISSSKTAMSRFSLSVFLPVIGAATKDGMDLVISSLPEKSILFNGNFGVDYDSKSLHFSILV